MVNAFHWRETTASSSTIKIGHCPPRLTQERIDDLTALVDAGYSYAKIAAMRRVSVNTVMRHNRRRKARNEQQMGVA